MKSVMHLSWEYPPWVVGALSQELKMLLPALAKSVPVKLVVRADSDGHSEIDGMSVYKVGTSVRTAPHTLAYAHTLNIDLVRGASRAIHEGEMPSLVHTHDWISSIAGAYLNAYFGIPLIISVYSTEFTRANSLSTLLNMGIYDIERSCFQRAEALVIGNMDMRNHLSKNYGIDGRKIFYASNDRALLGLYERWLQ